MFNEEIDNEQVQAVATFKVDIYDEDVVMYYENQNAFQPSRIRLQSKQHDAFSAILPFDIAVSRHLPPTFGRYTNFIGFIIFFQGNKDRYYFVGRHKIRYPANYIDTLLQSNANANVAIFDRNFMQILLLIVFGSKNIHQCRESSDLIAFMKGDLILYECFEKKSSIDIFRHRVESNNARLAKFDDYIDQYISELADKQT